MRVCLFALIAVGCGEDVSTEPPSRLRFVRASEPSATTPTPYQAWS